MYTEIEAKFLDIDKDALRLLLKKNGAKLIHEERMMRRRNFDYPDRRLEKKGAWIRVRDEGDIITLAYKQLFDRTIEGTKEISLEVEDFEKISSILLAAGFDCKSYQETKRERWDYNGIEVTIDTWPWIPAFVELEGPEEVKLKELALLFGLDWKKALHGSVEIAYQAYYDVSEQEICGWDTITFTPVPDWLAVRSRTS